MTHTTQHPQDDENEAPGPAQEGLYEEEKEDKKGGDEKMAMMYPTKPSKRRRYADDCMTSADAARELGITREMIGNLIRSGQIHSIVIGPRTVLVPKDEVARMKALPPRKPGRPRKHEDSDGNDGQAVGEPRLDS